MNPADAASKSSSGTTSTTNRAGPPAGSKSPAGNKKLGESAFLSAEARHARDAMGEAAARLKEHLKAAADPHWLTRRHPWAALGAAAVAGFAAGAAAIPSKEQQAMKKLAEFERLLHGPPPESAPPPPTSGNGRRERPGKESLLQTVIRE